MEHSSLKHNNEEDFVGVFIRAPVRLATPASITEPEPFILPDCPWP